MLSNSSNTFDRHPYLKHSTAGSEEFVDFDNDFQDSKPDENSACCGNPLRGCINCPPVKKLTFYEWFTANWDWKRPLHMEDIEEVWQAAQENK